MNAYVSSHDSSDFRPLLFGTVPQRLLACENGEHIFNQGDPADAVFFIASGKVKCAVLSRNGKQGVVAIFEAGEFFGEACLIGESRRSTTATTMMPSSIARVEKSTMLRTIHESPKFAERFISFLIDRNACYQGDLLCHLFGSSEKRLARALLLLANLHKEGREEWIIPRMSQDELAEIVGTTRARINYFMGKFRQLGLIDYISSRCGQIRIDRSGLEGMLSQELEWPGPQMPGMIDC